jgi:hypothetical protein
MDFFEVSMISENINEMENHKNHRTLLHRLWPTYPALLARPTAKAAYWPKPARARLVAAAGGGSMALAVRGHRHEN